MYYLDINMELPIGYSTVISSSLGRKQDAPQQTEKHPKNPSGWKEKVVKYTSNKSLTRNYSLLQVQCIFR